jgi:spermidine/putrescine transport system ATP-binding protein
LTDLGTPSLMASNERSGTTEPVRPAAVTLRGVEKRYTRQVAVHPLDLTVEDGEFFTLLGPSGCGKTTLLRMIAGLERPTGGSICIFGQDVTHRPPNKRPLNLVFQRATLFPHLSVADNIAFGPKLRRADKETLASLQERLLALVDLEGFGPRRVNELSGGQAQRVALARALANEPRVLLLDEPLSALDLAVRRQLQSKLKEIHRAVGTTFIYVTHDQEEALSMSDRVAVMRLGRVQQLGAPRHIYRHPSSAFVARFLGLSNVLDGQVAAGEAGTARVECPGLVVLAIATAGSPGRGERASVVVRPDLIELTAAGPEPPGTVNGVAGTVSDVRFAGAVVHYSVASGPTTWQVSLPASADRDFPPGCPVHLSWEPRACTVIPAG